MNRSSEICFIPSPVSSRHNLAGRIPAESSVGTPNPSLLFSPLFLHPAQNPRARSCIPVWRHDWTHPMLVPRAPAIAQKHKLEAGKNKEVHQNPQRKPPPFANSW
eukprot:EG_transcript_35150